MCTDSEKLEQRLLTLSKTKYNGELSVGAMCYKIAIEKGVDYVCLTCGGITKGKYNSWQIRTVEQIRGKVNKIKALGYDAVLNESDFCDHCSKTRVEQPIATFSIRFCEDSEYHVVKTNNVSEYECLLQFLLGEEKYSVSRGAEQALHKSIHIIQKMTGLGKDLQAEE